MSITSSNSAISKTLSFSAASKKEKVISKRLIEEPFHQVYATNCQEAGLSVYPAMKVMYTEPVSWLSALQDKRTSKTIMMRTTTSFASAAQRKSSCDTRKTQSTHILKERPNPPSKYEIYAVYNDSDREDCVDTLIYSHFPLKDDVMGVLQKTMLQFWSLRQLKFEFCDLTSDQLKALKWILVKRENITEVSLDGNPLKTQNYYVLLKNTVLASLSLRFCQIDSAGATKIAAHLQYPSMLTLNALDLSCNFIEDDGCKAIANALRTNRSLTHLALTSNQISNVGCTELMKVLQKFPLTHQEILIKRKLNMDYLMRCKVARVNSAPVISSGTKVEPIRTVVRPSTRAKTPPKRGTFGRSRKGTSPESLSRSSMASSKRSKHGVSRKPTPVLSPMSLITRDPHPFMHDCVHEDKQVFCSGNSTLQYLNLAYNSIDCMEIQEIKSMLLYQNLIKPGPRPPPGGVRLILDGNPIMKCMDSREIFELSEANSQASVNSKTPKRSQTR